MKIIKEVRQVGTADPIQSANVTVQSWPALALAGATTSNEDGLATITAQGTPGPVRVRSERSGSIYDEYSTNVSPVGQFDMEYLVTRLSVLIEDGIVPRYGDQFRATVSPGTLTLASGGVILGGYLALFPSSTPLAVTNGDRAAVAVLSGATVQLAEIAYSAIVSGTHVPLWRYTVASGQVVSGTLEGIGLMAGKRRGRKTVIGIARLESGFTLNASGELALSLPLTLEAGVTYDVRAKATLQGLGRDGGMAVGFDGAAGPYRSINGDITGRITNGWNYGAGVSGSPATAELWVRRDTALTGSAWALQATYGPTFNALAISSPGQVAVDSTGRILIADTGNNRLVILTSAGAYSTGITGLTGITGVSVGPSDSILVCFGKNYRYYTSGLVQTWTQSWPSEANFVHITNDGTYAYITTAANTFWKVNLTFGGLISSYGSSGSGNGQFNTPWGIAYSSTDGLIYVADSGNNRIQVFSTAGTYQRQWAAGGGNRGVAIDTSGRVFVASNANNFVNRYLAAGSFLDSFIQTAPGGIAVASGDVVWLSNTTDGTIAKWDEAVSNFPFEYGAGVLTAIAIPR